ncbi:MAG: hypothetical protein JO332_12860 [Planctomycetaceae bacterium]|nr:hypothetical protein [Planctomycetaceae bacterium]
MGLDGYVACDCLEKGTAQVPAAIAGLVKIDQDTGSTYFDSPDKRLRQVYSQWRASKPCPHDGSMLLVVRLGSANGIGLIRKFLTERVGDPETEFPVLWKRVVHSGVHSGGSLDVNDTMRLEVELQRRPTSDDPVVERFFAKLGRLVAAALSVGKPIGF